MTVGGCILRPLDVHIKDQPNLATSSSLAPGGLSTSEAGKLLRLFRMMFQLQGRRRNISLSTIYYIAHIWATVSHALTPPQLPYQTFRLSYRATSLTRRRSGKTFARNVSRTAFLYPRNGEPTSVSYSPINPPYHHPIRLHNPFRGYIRALQRSDTLLIISASWYCRHPCTASQFNNPTLRKQVGANAPGNGIRITPQRSVDK